jgi:hypothetical protein
MNEGGGVESPILQEAAATDPDQGIPYPGRDSPPGRNREVLGLREGYAVGVLTGLQKHGKPE